MSNLDDLNSANATYLAEEDVPFLLELVDIGHWKQVLKLREEIWALQVKYEQKCLSHDAIEADRQRLLEYSSIVERRAIQLQERVQELEIRIVWALMHGEGE